VLVHRPTFCTFLSASPVRAFYPAPGQSQTKGNTAQFPPDGLSTAPAAAAKAKHTGTHHALCTR